MMGEPWDHGVRVQYNFGKFWAGTVCTQVPASLCACCVAGTNCLTSLCSDVRMPTHGLLMRIRTCAYKTLMQCLAQGRHWVSVGSHSYYHMSQSLSIKGAFRAAPQAQMVPTRGAFPVKMGSQLYMHPSPAPELKPIPGTGSLVFHNGHTMNEQ